MFLYRVAYKGWMFHGSQVQPDVRTVEGDLQDALSRQGIEDRVRLISRTDSGVSALSNVFRLDVPVDLPRLNHSLDGIRVWAVSAVEVMPRVAMRKYRYFLIGDYPEEAVLSLKRFEGKHDFSGYVRGGEKVESEISKIEIKKFEFGYIVDFSARRFFWEQIRRIVGTVLGRTAPPEPLILLDIKFDREPEWSVLKNAFRGFADRMSLARALVEFSLQG